MMKAAPRASRLRDFGLTYLSTTHMLLAALGVCAVLWALVLFTIGR